MTEKKKIETVEKIRLSLGMTKTALAESIKVSRQYYNQMIREERMPDATFKKIMAILKPEADQDEIRMQNLTDNISFLINKLQTAEALLIEKDERIKELESKLKRRSDG